MSRRQRPGYTRRGLTVVLGLLLLWVGLAGCSSKYIPGIGSPSSPSGTPPSPKGKGGTYKPYTVLGQTYYPLGSAEGYSETGVAPGMVLIFTAKRRPTANGTTCTR